MNEKYVKLSFAVINDEIENTGKPDETEVIDLKLINSIIFKFIKLYQ